MKSVVKHVPASAEYVLEVLRDGHRQQCSYDPEADPSVELTFGTRVSEWRTACDLLGTRKLGEALNAAWELTLTPCEWRAVLEPSRSRTLREVCELIAARVQRPVVLSAGYCGASCRTAGAFLAIRLLLTRAGADRRAIRPSLPVAHLVRRFPEVFLGAVSRLAPGRLPTVVIRIPWYTVVLALLGLALAHLGVLAIAMVSAMASVIALGVTAPSGAVAVFVATTVGLAHLGTRLVVSRLTACAVRPAEVRFGSLVTFRALAEVIAGEQVEGRGGQTDR